MKRGIVLVWAIIVLVMTGCVNKYNYRSNSMVDSNQKYKIDIRVKKIIHQGFFSTDIKNRVILYINDEVVLKGNLERDESGELQGMYENQKLTLECSKDNIFTPLYCIVYLGNKKIGESKLEMYRR